jgi:hypothetical protein
LGCQGEKQKRRKGAKDIYRKVTFLAFTYSLECGIIMDV